MKSAEYKKATKRDAEMVKGTLILLLIPWFIFCVIAAIIFASCSDGCEPKETRCDGQWAQVCDGDGDWDDALDCEELKMTCCLYREENLYTCLMPEDCGE